MWEKIRDHWVKLAAVGVVLVVAAVCLAKHFAVSGDGPQYAKATNAVCAVIAVEMPGNHGGSIDMKVQELLTKLLKALLDNLRKENQDVI
jgi:hypothetical protein